MSYACSFLTLHLQESTKDGGRHQTCGAPHLKKILSSCASFSLFFVYLSLTLLVLSATCSSDHRCFLARACSRFPLFTLRLSLTISKHISHLRSEKRQSRAPPLPPRVIGANSRVRLYLCVCARACTCVRMCVKRKHGTFLYQAAFHFWVQTCILDGTRRHATCA
jgi:hypothetical protein